MAKTSKSQLSTAGGINKLLKRLRDGLSLRRKNIKIAREIDEGTDIREIARRYEVQPVIDAQIEFENRWWLEKIFDRLHLSFSQGTLLLFGVIAIPQLYFLPYVLFSGNQEFTLGYFSAFFGASLIIIVLLIMHNIQKGLVKLGRKTNEYLRKGKFVAPYHLYPEEAYSSAEKLDAFDETYRSFYTKPVMSQTLQKGFDLAFSKSYHLGSGLIAEIFVAIIFASRYVLGILPKSILSIWVPIQEITVSFLVFSYIQITILWFLIAMLAWTLFIVFSIVIQISGSPVGIRPFEPIKEYFKPIISLTLKISFALMSVFCWFTPYWVLWSLLPTDPVFRVPAVNLLTIALLIVVPFIILSFSLPFLKMHKGMDQSRERALLIKRSSLENLKKSKLENLNQRLAIQKHLIEDYKSIIKNSESVLNTPQLVEMVGTVLIPVLFFALSQL